MIQNAQTKQSQTPTLLHHWVYISQTDVISYQIMVCRHNQTITTAKTASAYVGTSGLAISINPTNSANFSRHTRRYSHFQGVSSKTLLCDKILPFPLTWIFINVIYFLNYFLQFYRHTFFERCHLKFYFATKLCCFHYYGFVITQFYFFKHFLLVKHNSVLKCLTIWFL